ncbi:carbohydrate ABC transporter permease [Vallitalea maricola]|uniref:Carbohydrate ABC transporter permease n=1 Tax=Vallitalea maricola TaxID=3074433 RepID=A0ACB5UQY3_9FIRM|nr:carbohydrate ABC transporter permease [Vallitalea sp. AN17-2]
MKKILSKIPSLVIKIFLNIWCGFSLFAFIWIVISSLKTNRQLFENMWGLFQNPQWDNYITIWKNYKLGIYFANSLIVVIVAVIGLLIICAPVAYVLSRIKFKMKNFFTKLFTFGMGVPYQLLLVPLFFILFKLNLINTLTGLCLVYIALSIPFTVFLMMGFFKTLPSTLEEASYIDGCSPIKTFFKIMLPLGRPALVTSGIFNLIWLWNEFLLALTLLSAEGKYTLSMGLYSLQGSMQYTGDWVSLFAGFTTVVVPTFLVYIILSRTIMEGLTMGAVKE